MGGMKWPRDAIPSLVSKRAPVIAPIHRMLRCATVGDTKEETRRNFQDALSAHFEVMREVGEPIPEPNASVDYVEVAA